MNAIRLRIPQSAVRSAVQAAVAGALLSALVAPAAGAAMAEDPAPPQMAATPPAERSPAPDPEKDTIALQPGQVIAPSVGQSPLRPDDDSAAGAVRVGQGLRPDGTEMVPSEVSRPWLIRQ